MPTGLTATLIGENERSFKDFALLCARHFGPLFFMRDDPLDKDIPDEVPTADADYYENKLLESLKRLENFKLLTKDDYAVKAKEQFDEDIKMYEASIEKNELIRYRYSSMLKKVMAWVPPSDDHAQIKKFMIEQIEGSMNSDIHDHSKPKLLSGKQWSDNELKSITEDIKYYENKYIEETQWQLKANEWIRQLKNSLISSNNTGDNFL